MTTDVCERCGAVHDPAKCKAHAKRQGGAQCQLPPMDGQEVCGVHGGRNPKARAAGAARVAETKMREALGRLNVVPVENPLAELQSLAGEAKAWKELCAEHVANLKAMRYGTDGGEAIRGEIVVFERAMDRCIVVLTAIAKLNIDERLVRIAEGQKTMVIQAVDAGIAAAGITGPAAIEARKVVARHLRSVPPPDSQAA